MTEYRFSYPGAEGGLFDLGVKSLKEGLGDSDLTDKYIFIQFELAFLGQLLPSKFVDVLVKFSEKDIILVSSNELLPLAQLYSQFFRNVVGVIENCCPLSEIVRRLLSKENLSTEPLLKSVTFTMRQALILECFYQGQSINMIAQKFKIDTKTAYTYKHYLTKKLSLKQISHLTML
ncbi:LuxR C-terminal-related transcriptional regulator [Dryocola sp. BD626]|uniref:LuxR C-terminal-related transcriptional regulator n=1 Tax=Dryocola sp. BD626 TaxID=3133273 RepID=UPI003F50A41C